MSIHEALLEVQSNLPAVGKGEEADTGKYTYQYASLPAVQAALFPVLHEAGIVWTVTVDGQRSVKGTATHADTGQSVESWWPLPSTDDPQRLGSALTYARRYLLCALVGLAPDGDDDGQTARTPTLGEFRAKCEPHGVVDVSGLLAKFNGDLTRAMEATGRWTDETWSRAAEEFGGDA